MTNGRTLAAIRPIVLTLVVNFAAVLAGFVTLPVAAQAWISPAMLVDHPESTERGVLPAKTGLRVLSRPRQTDPALDPPAHSVAINPTACRQPVCPKPVVHAAYRQPRYSLRPGDGSPRGPPAASLAQIL